jgi:hypothetical protein
MIYGEEKTRKRRIASEEYVNREDHWCRDFSVRSESWPIIEHWASECGYHLIAMKGRKRMYRKGNPGFYSTYIEIRHEPNRIVLASWIEVGTKLRLISLFLLPSELPIDPRGLKGIRTRRNACLELNMLLIRLRQPEIAESNSFHFLDLDMTTLVLMAALTIPLITFIVVLALQLEIRTGLSNPLLLEMFSRTGILAATALTLLLIHHLLFVRQLERDWLKVVSLTVFSLSFISFSIFSLTRTRTEMMEQRIAHYCLLHYSESDCDKKLAGLPDRERQALIKRLELFQKSLTKR